MWLPIFEVHPHRTEIMEVTDSLKSEITEGIKYAMLKMDRRREKEIDVLQRATINVRVTNY